MVYNDKYFFDFATLKTANEATKYYKVVFSKYESVARVYDLVELKASNTPFVLSYKATESNVFSPIRSSSAEINILYPYDAATDVPEPIDFFTDSDYLTWKVRLIEVTDSGATENLKWTGFLVESDIQYEWQDAFYYRLTATDNIGVLKEVPYSDTDNFRMPMYVPMDGVAISDFIIELVNLSGNPLNYKFACTYKFDSTEYTLPEMFTSRYSALDWEKNTPLMCYDILKDLLTAIGCIIYQDNFYGTWNIVSVHEISTRADNLVPFVEYDSAKAFVTTGNLDFDSSINTGDNDLVWRDKNQIVTLNKSYTNVEMVHKYKPKNLLKNYSFQESTNDNPPDGWDIQGTFPVTINTDTYLLTGVTYDDQMLKNDNSELNSAGIDISNYLYQEVSYVDTPLEGIDFGDEIAFYVEFTSYIKDSTFNTVGGNLEGYNFQIANNLSGGLLKFDLSNATNISLGGVWNAGGQGRIPVFAPKTAGLLRVKCLTAFTDLYDYTSLRFLKYRYNSGGTGQFYTVDNSKFCLVPIFIGGYGSSLDKFSYIALKGVRGQNIDLSRKLTLNTMFGNLFGILALDGCGWYFHECSIGVKVGTPEYLTGDEDLWQNTYDSGEVNNNYLTALVCYNVLNHLSQPRRKITGNVYGEDINYLKLFEVQGANKKSANIVIADNFRTRVQANSGTVETSNCGSDFLAEFNVENAKFMMLEAKFDYRNSTTNVTIIEDVSNKEFTGFGNIGDISYGSSVLPTSTGSNSANQDRTDGETP